MRFMITILGIMMVSLTASADNAKVTGCRVILQYAEPCAQNKETCKIIHNSTSAENEQMLKNKGYNIVEDFSDADFSFLSIARTLKFDFPLNKTEHNRLLRLRRTITGQVFVGNGISDSFVYGEVRAANIAWEQLPNCSELVNN